MTRPPAPTRPLAGGAGAAVAGAVQEVLAARRGVDAIYHFLTEEVPALVLAAMREDVPRSVGEPSAAGGLSATGEPPGTGGPRCEIVRSRLKPHRKLSVYLNVTIDGRTRPAALTWTESASSAGRGAAPAAANATGPAGMTLLLAPVDPAFPRLPDLYDPERAARLLGRTAGPHLVVTPLRYRPGQRHVLHLGDGPGTPGVYAKCSHDGGPRIVARSRAVARALDSWGGPASVNRPRAYLATHRVVLWEGEPGTPLSRSVVDRPALAHAAGTVLRALHAFPSHHAGMSDPTAEAAATRRATEHVTALRPSTGARLLRLTDRALSELLDLPAESGHLLHGDIKCDNLLVDGDLLRIVDLDRVVAGDPALDVGKLSADLRWWAMTRAADGDALVDAVLAGYGPCDPGRRARAACYDVLFQLRAAGRRVHLHEPSWAERVDECVELAERTWRRRR